MPGVNPFVLQCFDTVNWAVSRFCSL